MNYLFMLLFFVIIQQEQVNAQLKNTLEDFDYKKKEKKTFEEPDYDEYILKNGFFLGGIFQSTSVRVTNTTVSLNRYNPVLLNGIGLGFRLGNRWYFGRMRTYRPGFGAVWGRLNLILGRVQNSTALIPYLAIAPANISFVNAFSFGGKFGLEVNINFGANLIVDSNSSDIMLGYLVNPTIKFRYKSLAIGLDLTITAGDSIRLNELQYQATLIGLSIGGKF